MKYRLFIVSTLIFMLFLLCHASGQTASFETNLFSINLPKYIKHVSPGEPKENEGDAFTYMFIDANKDKAKSVLIVITGEMITGKMNIKKIGKDFALHSITNELRDSVMKSKKCKGQASDITRTHIGNSDALYFEKVNRDCHAVLERYWSVVKGEYFITVYMAKSADAEDKVLYEIEEAIKQVKLK